MTPRRKKPRSLEHNMQAAFVRWAGMASGHTPALSMLYANANGAKRDAITGAMLKAEGVRKGVPDMTLPVPVGPYHGLFLELKVRPNKPSPEQLWWIDKLTIQGYKAVVVYTLQDAIDLTMDYLRGKL